MAGEFSSLCSALGPLELVHGMTKEFICLPIIIGHNEFNRIFKISRFSISEIFFRKIDLNIFAALLESFKSSLSFPKIIVGRWISRMVFDSQHIGLNQIFHFPIVLILWILMVLPGVHKFVGFFRIHICSFSVDEILLRNVIVCWLIFTQRWLNEESIASPVPWHMSRVVPFWHAVIILFISGFSYIAK